MGNRWIVRNSKLFQRSIPIEQAREDGSDRHYKYNLKAEHQDLHMFWNMRKQRRHSFAKFFFFFWPEYLYDIWHILMKWRAQKELCFSCRVNRFLR